MLFAASGILDNFEILFAVLLPNTTTTHTITQYKSDNADTFLWFLGWFWFRQKNWIRKKDMDILWNTGVCCSRNYS